MDYKQLISQKITLEGVEQEQLHNAIIIPPDSNNGDFTIACFPFAKTLRKSPMQIAEDIKKCFEPLPSFLLSVNAVAGYVNFKISRKEFITLALKNAKKKGADFKPFKANKKTVLVEYSSVNIAKPFHIGHLLTTVIGGSLYKIHKYLGYNTVGINHLGDWGTQFGKLISAFKRWGNDKDLDNGGIDYLNGLYVKFHKEAKDNPELEDEARGYFKQIEEGEKDALVIFEKFKAITMTEVGKVYERLGVHFDSYAGESFYGDKMGSVLDTLKKKKLLTESKGALVVDLEKYDMPPCLILKSDGASLYATRDLAAAIYRKKTYNFDKNLYIVAYQQNLHFAQVFKVLELAGYDWAKDCVHVPFGMVSLEGSGKLSTREGNVVYLSDVLDAAVEKTKNIISDKNPDLINKEKTAEMVGVGAVIFMALSTNRLKDMVFSLDKALNFDGETAPYLQYTHARCCSILEKADNKAKANDDLSDDEGFELVKMIDKYDTVIEQAALKYEPSIIARYLVDLAQSFNRYYISHRIVGDKGRQGLTELVRNVLKNGLGLLLIDAPEKM
ncbi:MAG: arginine--tRNA ligase [Firmicutes bacterium]|nr:arginine--tRNA ligase [Bacillota bacterium]